YVSEQTVRGSPVDTEAEPREAMRNVLHCPLRALRYGVIHFGIEQHPVLGALEYREMRGLAGTRRTNLSPPCSGADQRNLLACQADAGIPRRGVHLDALEVGETRNVGPTPPVKRTLSVDDGIGRNRLLCAIVGSDRNVPEIRRLVEYARHHA